MAVANTNLLELLGKQVSFSWLGADGVISDRWTIDQYCFLS